MSPDDVYRLIGKFFLETRLQLEQAGAAVRDLEGKLARAEREREELLSLVHASRDGL